MMVLVWVVVDGIYLSIFLNTNCCMKQLLYGSSIWRFIGIKTFNCLDVDHKVASNKSRFDQYDVYVKFSKLMP